MKKQFYRIGEHATLRPWDRPSYEAVAVWWEDFQKTKHLDQFDVWICGGVVEGTETWEEFYNYRAKYERNGSIHEIPAKIPRQSYEQAMSWALRAHKILGCKGISRSDFRYDKINDQLYLLEK